MKPFLLFFCLILLSTNIAFSQNAAVEKPVFTYSCFQNPDKTWGYDLHRTRKLFIHQPTIPAVAGVKGFGTREAATKVAKLALQKLKDKPNDFPTISVEELKNFKIIN
jgi:hypothetical protein